jgi:hypothetical protein
MSNDLWKKNRNLYVQVLKSQLESKPQLEAPFDKSPPDGSLPKLPSWMNFYLTDPSQTRIKSPSDAKQKQKDIVVFEMRHPKVSDRTIKTTNATIHLESLNDLGTSKVQYSKSPSPIRDDLHILAEIPQKIQGVSNQRRMEDRLYVQHMESQLLEERTKRLMMERQMREENEILSKQIIRLEQELAEVKSVISRVQNGATPQEITDRSDTEFLSYLIKFESACTNLLAQRSKVEK